LNPTDRLRKYLLSCSPLAIALSGGIDSSTLTFFCHANGIEFTSYTFSGEHITPYEMEHVQGWVAENSIPHVFIPCRPLNNPRVASNTRDRCYYCKYDLYSRLKSSVDSGTTIIDGTNASDLKKYRPGLYALNELEIKTPFAGTGFDRPMVEKLAWDMGMNIPVFSRSCLFTRFQYGYHLNPLLVKRLGRAEDFLLKAGIFSFRIRFHTDGTILVQVAFSEKKAFLNIKPGFHALMQELCFYPYQVQYMEFSRISGYFDRG